MTDFNGFSEFAMRADFSEIILFSQGLKPWNAVQVIHLRWINRKSGGQAWGWAAESITIAFVLINQSRGRKVTPCLTKTSRIRLLPKIIGKSM